MRLPIWFLILLQAMGCVARQHETPTTQLATDVDPATTQPSFWLEKPAVATIESPDFQELWNASEEAARDFLFRPDRSDMRAGVMTTIPVISAQWFEPWRREVRTSDEHNESSLATVRRTIRFEFERTSDERFQVTPKVLIERQAFAEQRITSVVLYRSVFTRPVNPRQRQYGTRESDVGVSLPSRYWYPIGRDTALEKALAELIRKKLR